MLFDEIEYFWPAETEQVRQRFTRLMLDNIPTQCQMGIASRDNTHSSARHSINVGDDLTASSSPCTATMTACTS